MSKKALSYSVTNLDSSFVSCVPDYESYALFYSANAGHEINRFVRITNKNTNKSIYRKVSGRNGILANQVALAYKTQKELDVQPDSSVEVRPASFWLYYWNNSEKYLKCTFRLAVIGFFITVITSILSLFKDIICLLSSLC